MGVGRKDCLKGDMKEYENNRNEKTEWNKEMLRWKERPVLFSCFESRAIVSRRTERGLFHRGGIVVLAVQWSNTNGQGKRRGDEGMRG